MNFVKNETLKLSILWKMKLWNCEFYEKWDFKIVNFVKNDILKLWIWEKWDFEKVNFCIKIADFTQCAHMYPRGSFLSLEAFQKHINQIILIPSNGRPSKRFGIITFCCAKPFPSITSAHHVDDTFQDFDGVRWPGGGHGSEHFPLRPSPISIAPGGFPIHRVQIQNFHGI